MDFRQVKNFLKFFKIEGTILSGSYIKVNWNKNSQVLTWWGIRIVEVVVGGGVGVRNILFNSFTTGKNTLIIDCNGTRPVWNHSLLNCFPSAKDWCRKFLLSLFFLNLMARWEVRRVEIIISWVERYGRWNFYIRNLKNKSK